MQLLGDALGFAPFVLFFTKIALTLSCAFKQFQGSFSALQLRNVEADTLDQCLTLCFEEQECKFAAYVYTENSLQTSITTLSKEVKQGPSARNCELLAKGNSTVDRDDYFELFELYRDVDEHLSDTAKTSESGCGEKLDSEQILETCFSLEHYQTCKIHVYRERPSFCNPVALHRGSQNLPHYTSSSAEPEDTRIGYVFAKYCECAATYPIGLYRWTDESTNTSEYFLTLNEKGPDPVYPPTLDGMSFVADSPIFFVVNYTC